MRLPDGTAQTVRVFYFPAMERQQAQELTTVVRSIGEIRSSFLYYGARALAIRGTPAQIALTEWLLSEIPRTGPSGARDFQLDGKGEDVVQVFHLPSSYSVEAVAADHDCHPNIDSDPPHVHLQRDTRDRGARFSGPDRFRRTAACRASVSHGIKQIADPDFVGG
jgi:hypothetical protein